MFISKADLLTRRRRLHPVLTALVAVAAMGAAVPSASALSPWWHLSGSSRPSHIQPGMATDEVLKLTVKATEGTFTVDREELEQELGVSHEGSVVVKFDATHEELQTALEGLYGAGNVEVPEGQGDAAGDKPYKIVFKGEYADQLMAVPSVYGGKVVQVSAGRPDGVIVVDFENTGDAEANGEINPIKVSDVLPKGLKAVFMALEKTSGISAIAGDQSCSLKTLTCESFGSNRFSPPVLVGPYEMLELRIFVVVEGATSGEVNEASISGGGAPPASIRKPIAIGDEPTPFGVESNELTAENEGGTLDTQAGSHPFELTDTLMLNQAAEEAQGQIGFAKEGFGGATAPNGEPNMEVAGGQVKDLHFKLPVGLIGNPTVLPQCPIGDFLHNQGGVEDLCPPQTAIGVVLIKVREPFIGTLKFRLPLFNLEPRFGEPARFGFFVPVGNVPVLLDTSIRAGEDYGVTVSVDNIDQNIEFLSSDVTFWGTPGDPRHDGERGWGCIGESASEERCHPLEESFPPPFLTMPTACTGPLHTSVEGDSWNEEGVFTPPLEYVFHDDLGRPASMDGCNREPFTPSVKVTPDGQAGSTPTGLTVDEHVSQLSTLDPTGLAESDVKGLSVTLPEGVAINPAGADGLQACTQEQIGLESGEATSCPEAAKIATAKIRTPLLPEPLEGAAYLATQDTNPFGSLVAIYVFAENAREGVRAKATGEVIPNPVTGQLTAHFEGDPVFESDPRYAGVPEAQFLPELPFEDVELHFFGGDRAPLGTPAKCGTYTTTGTFTPWSGNPTTESSSTFDIVSGPNGSPCENPLQFKPSLTAGTTSIQAGGFTPFTTTMGREDGEQNLQGIQLHMPLGLSGTLSTVKLCGEAQANAGTCGPESEIGETIVSVGLGGDPYTVKGGKVYITGPYKGAPFGLSIVNPAKAGPFDLGYVVVRAKIEVNQETAALTITTDNEGPYKVPTIIDGIPLQIKHVSVDIDRPNFTFNPTNCSPLAITGTLDSTEGATDQLSVPFQVTNCAVLAFKPKLEASTSGKTSRAGGASLTVKLGYPAGPYDANISKVKVELPKALPSRLTTLQKACAAAVFESNPAACPPASIVGHATAVTPVLPVPLNGPAYFVSHGGEAFPSLIIVLQGYGVTVHLVGSTFINKAGITSSTFKAVPDVPVGTFELTLPEGPFSALAANGNLCKQKLAMPTEFIGQNGALIKTSTKIAVTGCGKAKKAKHAKKRAKHGKTRKKK